MLNKIFLVLLAVAIISMSVLTFFSYNWLQSVDKPATVAANFELYSGLAWTFLWVSSLVLLILANILLWTNRNIWSLWATFLYFASFILINTWWLGELLFDYKKQNGLSDGAFSVGALFGAVLCIVVGVGVFFDQFIVTRLHDKIQNKPQVVVAEDNQVIETDSDKVS